MILFRKIPASTRLLAVACSALMLVSACSDESVSRVERVVEPTTIPAPSGVGENGQELTLEVIDGGDTTGLIITDHRGFAVYGVTGETPTGDPICEGDCLDVWIPVVLRDAAVSSQLDTALFSVWTRPDGIAQAVYADVPLYLWSGDSEVGITGGAGVAGTWFALTETAGFVAAK